MKNRCLVLAFASLVWIGTTTRADAQGGVSQPERNANGAPQRIALVLDFATCAGSSVEVTCELTGPSGKPAGSITVTFLGVINSGATSRSSKENWLYQLDGGTISVLSATAWTTVGALVPDETGFAPAALGFAIGEIASGTGRFKKAAGTITMRWDADLCICLIEFA